MAKLKRSTDVSNLLKSILKTAVYILDQTDRAASDLRDRMSEGADRVSDRVSDLADQGRSVIYGQDHTLRHILLFAAGVGVGVSAGILLAPSSGEELRSSMREKVEDIGDRVRGRFSSGTGTRSTGTEGGI
jgi:gas vesicle protein